MLEAAGAMTLGRLCLIFCLLLALFPAQAAPPAAVPDGGRAPSSGKVTPANYRLQPGDELDLHIFSLPSQDRNVEVRADGGFYHAVLGEVQAAGKTLAELRVEIGRRLARQLRNPTFQLGLKTYAKSEVSVLGEVKNQGKFSFYYGATVLDVLAQAGGLSEKADPEYATLLRSGRTIELDLKPPGPGASTPLPLQPEDIIYVHPGLRISVAGEVQKPAVYAISRRALSPIGEALKAAAGTKPTAALGRVKIIRPSEPAPLVIDLDTAQGTPLKDGDAVFVPERQALVLGATNKPGPVALANDQAPLLDVLAGGGVTPDSDLSRVVVVRAAELRAKEPKREEYNLQEFVEDGKGQPAVFIRDGDLVYVPSVSKNPGLFDNPFNLLNIIFLARSFFI